VHDPERPAAALVAKQSALLRIVLGRNVVHLVFLLLWHNALQLRPAFVGLSKA